MSLELTVDGFGWIKSTYFLEEFIKDYNENFNDRCILEADIKLGISCKELFFLSEIVRINKQKN